MYQFCLEGTTLFTRDLSICDAVLKFNETTKLFLLAKYDEAIILAKRLTADNAMSIDNGPLEKEKRLSLSF